MNQKINFGVFFSRSFRHSKRLPSRLETLSGSRRRHGRPDRDSGKLLLCPHDRACPDWGSICKEKGRADQNIEREKHHLQSSGHRATLEISVNSIFLLFLKWTKKVIYQLSLFKLDTILHILVTAPFPFFLLFRHKHSRHDHTDEIKIVVCELNKLKTKKFRCIVAWLKQIVKFQTWYLQSITKTSISLF